MSKYTIFRTNKFKKDYKKMMKRTIFDEKEFIKVVSMLANGEELPEKYCNHILEPKSNRSECHIKPDWLLVYSIDNDILILTLTRTGTHSDLF